MKEYYFLVILGNEVKKKNAESLQKLKELGETRMLANNVYVLTRVSEQVVGHSEIRDILALEGTSIVIVIKLDDEFAASWFLDEDDSAYFKNIFTKIYGNK